MESITPWQIQYKHHAAPMLPFPRVNSHTRGNICKGGGTWSVRVLQFCKVAEHLVLRKHIRRGRVASEE